MGRRSLINSLTEEQKILIENMLYGYDNCNYKKKWFNSDGIVDNTDSTISNRTGIPLNQVSLYTNVISRLRYEKFINKVNKKNNGKK